MNMKWTMMAATVLAACLSAPLATALAEPIELQWWHAMTSVNADRVNKIAADFNASQAAYKILPVFKGSYAETMNAGVAAYRAGNAPHIIQIFEIGTATIMAAKGAVGFPLFDLEINTADIGNLNFADFVGATGGTVTVLSETIATPLPALPLFGSAVLALAGLAWFRGKVS